MLMQLVYCSRPTSTPTELVASLLPLSTNNNRNKNITGLIITCEHFIMQVIEGERNDINYLYNKIVNDPRHTDVTLLRYNTQTNREFGDWHLVHTNFDEVTSEYINIIVAKSDLNTDTMTGIKALTLLRHMSARLRVYDEKSH